MLLTNRQDLTQTHSKTITGHPHSGRHAFVRIGTPFPVESFLEKKEDPEETNR